MKSNHVASTSCPPISKDKKAANGLPFNLLAPAPGTSRHNHKRTAAPAPASTTQETLQPSRHQQNQDSNAADNDGIQLPAVRSESSLQLDAAPHRSRTGVGGNIASGNFTMRESAIIQDARRKLTISAEASAGNCVQQEGRKPGLAAIRARSQSCLLQPDETIARLPLTSRSATRGFLHFMSGAPDEDDDTQQSVHARQTGTMSLGGSTLVYGGGGVPIVVAAEDALLAVASRMGIVRQPTDAENLGATGSRPRATMKASVSVNQVSPLGIAFKAFEKTIDSLGVRDASLSTADVVDRHIMAATAQLKCRYCDLINEKLQDAPTLYVVHSWQHSFLGMMDAVRQYVLQLRSSTEDVFIWIDILCINMHQERVPQDIATVKDIIQASDRMLIVLDRHGSVITRTWCIWEVWQATLSERFDKLVVLTTSWAWEDLLHAYLTMDIAHTGSAAQRERQLLLGEMQRSVDLSQLALSLRDAMLQGAKREMQRSEKLASVNPRRFGAAATTYALLLSMHSRYGEAEETMRQVMRLYDKSPAREVSERELAAAAYQLACILRDQGRLPDAERVLQEFVNQFRGMQDELYMDGVSALADILTQRKYYTKAEMLARKMLEEKVKVYGRHHHQVVSSMLQLAGIAAAQKLFEEAEQHLREVLACVSEMFHGETAESATAYHMMAQCTFYTNRLTEAKTLCDRALTLRLKLYGPDHPHTLDSKAFQAEMLIKERRPKDAEQLLAAITASRMRSYGVEHHTTLASLGQLADLLRNLHRDDEADAVEQRIIAAGRQLLRYTKIDKFQSLSWVTSYLAHRDHLLDKAAMFLAKAYIVFKEKLNSEHELTTMTKGQLTEIIDKVKWIGSNALEQAQIFNSATQFGVAEVMFKQAYSISKLVSPEADHKPLAQGLADALFGQGKVQEAKTIMRAAGLSRKGMKQNMPASYLRWLNTRVAKYMDRAADEEDDIG